MKEMLINKEGKTRVPKRLEERRDQKCGEKERREETGGRRKRGKDSASYPQICMTFSLWLRTRSLADSALHL